MTRRRNVSAWPTYLLKGVPESERRHLTSSAAAQNISISDVVRRILCDHYRMVCPPESYGYDPARDDGALTILLRLQPRLARALDREKARTGRTKRRIILDTIEAHQKEAA